MLFRIIDHYESENKDIDEEIVEEIDEEIHEEPISCFVCFETQFDNNDIISLKNQTDYYKFCKCDGYIHINCLNLWYEKNPECPICRNSMKHLRYLELYQLYEYYTCAIYLLSVIRKIVAGSLIFIIKLSHSIILVMCVFIILKTINKIYSDIIYELKNKMYNYYELYDYNDYELYHYNDVSLYHYNNYSLENYREPLVNTIIPA
jgi:hypothetical protein